MKKESLFQEEKIISDKAVALSIIILLLLITLGSFLFFRYPEEERKEEVVREEKDEGEEEGRGEENFFIEKEENSLEEETRELKEIAFGFLGNSYQGGPLGEGEGEVLYREDVFDCTTFVLTVVAKENANGKTPEEVMKKINYHPPGEVSYGNRLHFSTYRNEVSEYFEDITEDVGGSFVKEKSVVLNKKQGEDNKRLIDIDWEEEILVNYIPISDVSFALKNLPSKAGIGFVRENSFELGLDINHEGFVFNGQDFVHASSKEGKVIKENLLDYLGNHNYDGVLFYQTKVLK